jgi:chromosome partitioning protein
MAAKQEYGLRTIVLASRKGGAGKTTLAAHLAVEALRQQAGPVAIIDSDPMGGLASWWNVRKADEPAYAQVGTRGLREVLAQLQSDRVRLVVIDTPPAANSSIGSIIAAADLVIVPVVPSPNDLRAIGETLELIEGQGRPLIFALNNTTARAKLTHEAASALSQYGTVAPIAISTRQDFRSSMIDGLTVCEVSPGGKSAAEIAELWRYIANRMERRAGGSHGTTVAA